jgi:hypothetical protein
MTIMTIIRNAEGAVINIGPWDYMNEEREDGDIVHNPLPDGAYEDQAEIVERADGGLEAA